MKPKLKLTGALMVIMIISCLQEKQKKIGVLFATLQEQRFQKESQIVKESITSQGIPCLLANANNDASTQERQFDSLMKEGINVLIIGAVNFSIGRTITRKAREHGIQTIVYDGFFNGDIDYCVRFSDKEVGKLMAEYALQKKPSGKYILIGGDGTVPNAKDIHDAELEVLLPHNIEIAHDLYMEEWSKKEAYKAIENILKHTCQEPFDVVLVSSDNMTQGVIAALQDAKVSFWPIITGQDGSVEACQSIREGKQTMSILKDSKKIAQQVALMAVDCTQGKVPETNGITPAKTWDGNAQEIPTFFIKLEVIDKETIKE